MKKTFVMLLAVAVVLSGVIGSISCSNEEEMPVAEQVMPNSEAAALAALRQEIMQLSQVRNTEAGSQKPASFFQRFKRYLKRLVFADAVGALRGASHAGAGVGKLGGALIGGVASSALAAIPAINRRVVITPLSSTLNLYTPAPLPVFNDSTISLGDGIVIGDPSSITLSDSIGYYHNVALIKLNEEHPDWLELPTPTIVSNLTSQVEDVVGLSHGRLLSDSLNNDIDFQNFNNNVISFYDETETYEEFVAMFKEYYPSMSDEIAVIEEFINGFDDIDMVVADQVVFSRKVLNLINDSEGLSDETKHALRSGVLVGNASAKLWNPEAFEE